MKVFDETDHILSRHFVDAVPFLNVAFLRKYPQSIIIYACFPDVVSAIELDRAAECATEIQFLKEPAIYAVHTLANVVAVALNVLVTF